ncbi:MAG: glycosyltransferase family 4 protein [Kiritimatiellia bacterium]|jgi:glycosyltransferase involved in cell wall biosynthesis
MKRLVVIALGISPPGTMGGNTKIILEILQNLPASIRCLVVTSKPETFAENEIHERPGLVIAPVPIYPKNERLHHLGACLHAVRTVRQAFETHKVGANDIVYCVSDFMPDVLPAFLLQKRLGFIWIPSFFLFVPSVLENLRRRYGFPVLKYFVYHLYQQIVRTMMLARCAGVVVTNTADIHRFPPRLHPNILAIYGGVNVEQIPNEAPGEPDFDAVFCSRLHPQKGIDGLLDIWRCVVDEIPSAKLAIIGNGEPPYERKLRKKAEHLAIESNLTWLGYVNHEAKFAIYRRSKMLLHATIYDNNGMVAAEALCAGLPVVLYDLPALRHVYDVGCVKVPEGDSRQYAETVIKMLHDPAFAERIRPTPDQVEALREHWRWFNRTKLFVEFLSRFQHTDREPSKT